jgi:hypothetical protein
MFLIAMGSAVSIRPMATTVILWLTLLLLMALPHGLLIGVHAEGDLK